MLTKSLKKTLEQEKLDLLQEVKELRASIAELSSHRRELAEALDLMTGRPVQKVEAWHVPNDFTIDCGIDSQTKEFDKFFTANDPFIEETRRLLMEDD